jgi:mRNA interferase MazF
LLANVTVTAVTATVRGLPTEVPIGKGEGVTRESVVNCDNLFTIPKSALGRRGGRLSPASLERLRAALLIALDLERL